MEGQEVEQEELFSDDDVMEEQDLEQEDEEEEDLAPGPSTSWQPAYETVPQLDPSDQQDQETLTQTLSQTHFIRQSNAFTLSRSLKK